MRINLLDVEVGESASPSPYATTSEDDAVEFMDREGLSFELPELPGGWSFVFFSTEITPFGHSEWVTGALDDGADHFVLLIDSDFPCEAPNDTGAGDHAVALWEVPHAGEVTACRNGRGCI